MGDRQRRKVAEAVAPYLEPDETVGAAMIGQMPVPPVTFLFIVPIPLVFMQKFRTIVVTERNVYVFPHKWARTYTYSGPPYRSPISEARLETGRTWARLDDGPRIWGALAGSPAHEVRDAVADAQGSSAQ